MSRKNLFLIWVEQKHFWQHRDKYIASEKNIKEKGIQRKKKSDHNRTVKEIMIKFWIEYFLKNLERNKDIE